MSTRREFLKVVGLSGGALVLGIRIADAAEEVAPAFEPNAWLRIDPDGSILLRVGKSEMGQGIRTSLPAILAEELDADFSRVRIEQASPGPDFRNLGTGGSWSTQGSWDTLRAAGAAARAMLVAAAAARWSVPPVSCWTEASTVVHPESGRRASYGELAAEAARQPVPEEPPLKAPSSWRLIGQPRKRIDAPDIVTGRARYGIDVRRPGMLYAVVARAPQLGSKVASFEGEAAQRVPGVRRVVEIPTGVAVLAENSWAALRGREALSIEWTESPHASFDSAAHLEALVRGTETPGITIRRDGAGRSALAGAAERLEAVYRYPFLAHASVEPVNCTVLAQGDRCTIWTPSQTPNSVQWAASQLLGIPESAVTVHVTLLGGGFGRRLGIDFDVEAIRIAKLAPGKPVHLLWSREDALRHGYFEAASAHRMIAGLDDQGHLVAWEHREACTPHNARSVVTDEQKRDPDTVRGWAWGVYDSPYAVPDAEMSYTVFDSPMLIGPWRAVFSPPAVFARECFVDEIAQHTSEDPLALRLELLGAHDPSMAPIYTIADQEIDRRRVRTVLETVAEHAGWGEPLPAGRARGLACNAYHTGTYIAYVVEVSLRDRPVSGHLPFVVHRVVGAVDCGVVVNPLGVRQQVESGILWALSAMKSEITVEQGAIQQSNYSDFQVAMIEDTPARIDTHLVDSGDDHPRGIGEPTVCPLAPAVANALSRLTGRRIRRLPVRAGDLA